MPYVTRLALLDTRWRCALARGALRIKLADFADLPAIAQFSRSTAPPAGSSQLGAMHTRRAVAQIPSRYESLLADPGHTVLLAIDDPATAAGAGDPATEDVIVGMAVL